MLPQSIIDASQRCHMAFSALCQYDQLVSEAYLDGRALSASEQYEYDARQYAYTIASEELQRISAAAYEQAWLTSRYHT